MLILGYLQNRDAPLVGSIDGITFEAFIIQKLVPQLWKGAYVFMDNYGIHKGEEIEKALKKAGASLIFFPPYSPDFSPIENFWSRVKSILCTWAARTYKALSEAITTAFKQVEKQEFWNFYSLLLLYLIYLKKAIVGKKM